MLAVLTFGAADCRNPQRPVSGTDRHQNGQAPREGLAGRVTSLSGGPLAGAFVRAESLDNPSRLVPEIAIFTTPDGRYFWPLSPGSYRISVSAEGHQTAMGEATVRSGRRSVLDFVLRPRSE
ncbi:MAG: carboxypeptidase-like regulatory domain-containing protein [Thermoanaerobaculia bacterium]